MLHCRYERASFCNDVQWFPICREEKSSQVIILVSVTSDLPGGMAEALPAPRCLLLFGQMEFLKFAPRLMSAVDLWCCI